MKEVIDNTMTQVIPKDKPVWTEWQVTGLIMLVACLCVVGLFWPTIQSMVDVWANSRTFAHGFLVVPAAGYLVWSYRQQLVPLVPRPSAWGILALCFSGIGWVLGAMSGLVWLQQAAVVAALPGLVWTIYGTEIVRRLSWPLGFLIFLLPVGTSLEPWLQDITAWLIQRGLDLSGITYASRDYHIQVGRVDWEVAPDCGGLRYLLPGLSLAYAFATLTYRQPARRIMFLAFCALALMVANGLRAYGVIMGNYLGIAAGTDHRVFSYTIYGITMPLLFWVGLKWKQQFGTEVAAPPPVVGRSDRRKTIVLPLCGVVLLCLMRLALWFQLPAS